MDRLDAWITSSMYRRDLLLVECPACEEDTPVTAETEYGATYWTPEECANPTCRRAFTGDERWETDEGPDPHDRWEGS